MPKSEPKKEPRRKKRLKKKHVKKKGKKKVKKIKYKAAIVRRAYAPYNPHFFPKWTVRRKHFKACRIQAKRCHAKSAGLKKLAAHHAKKAAVRQGQWWHFWKWFGGKVARAKAAKDRRWAARLRAKLKAAVKKHHKHCGRAFIKCMSHNTKNKTFIHHGVEKEHSTISRKDHQTVIGHMMKAMKHSGKKKGKKKGKKHSGKKHKMILMSQKIAKAMVDHWYQSKAARKTDSQKGKNGVERWVSHALPPWCSDGPCGWKNEKPPSKKAEQGKKKHFLHLFKHFKKGKKKGKKHSDQKHKMILMSQRIAKAIYDHWWQSEGARETDEQEGKNGIARWVNKAMPPWCGDGPCGWPEERRQPSKKVEHGKKKHFLHLFKGLVKGKKKGKYAAKRPPSPHLGKLEKNKKKGKK
jgi:hypothetical protein